MSKPLIIIGASGHGKVIADIALKNNITVKGFLDDDETKGNTFIGFPLLGKIENYTKYPDCDFVIAIGNQKIRKEISEKLDAAWATLIHPNAAVSEIETEIGEGTVVMANAVINPSAKVGKHCIINTGAVVEHDNVIEDFVHISPNATLAGTVKIGESTHIGAGAAVINGVAVAKDCIVGAGAAVINDITESGVFVGVPAKKIR